MDGGIWKGWNVKYKKSRKSLCTLYPKSGYFVLLIVIGAKEANGAIGKMLGIDVTGNEILRDVKELIALRVKPKK